MKIKTSVSEKERARILTTIDEGARRALEGYRSSSDFAVAVYALKRAELNAYASGEKSLTDLPILMAEASALAKSPGDIIETWRQKIASEDLIVPQLEAKRQALRARVKSARSVAELHEVEATIDWSISA